MERIPTRPPADYESTIIEQAVSALTAFGGDLERADAVILLSMWARRAHLTADDRTAVLDAFGPPPQVPAYAAGFTIGARR